MNYILLIKGKIKRVKRLSEAQLIEKNREFINYKPSVKKKDRKSQKRFREKITLNYNLFFNFSFRVQ